jgi:methyl-accepting chemotaxis protein
MEHLMQSWLSQKVAGLTLAPSILLLFFIVFSLWGSYKTYSGAKLTSTEASIALYTNKALSELQIERGLSAGFISSKGQEFASQLRNQRKKVDLAVQSILEFENADNIPNIQSSLLQPVKTLFAKIKNRRVAVDQQSTTVALTVEDYTALTSALVQFNGYLVSVAKNALGKQKFILLYQLSKLQENAGLERALLSSVFAKQAIDQEQQIAFNKLVSFQSSQLSDLSVLATEEFRQILNEFTNSKGQKDIESFRQQAEKINQSPSEITSTEWFSAASLRIEGIVTLNEQLFDQLQEHAAEETSVSFFIVVIDIILVIITCVLAGLIFWILQLRKAQSKELQSKLKYTVNNLDLSLTIDKISNDDLGLVALQVNELIEKFRLDLESYQISANEITLASKLTAEASSQTSTNIQNQQQQIKLSLLSAETLGIGISEDIASIAKLNKYASQSSQMVIAGETTVAQATKGIRATADEVKKVGQTIELLNQRVDDILRMVDVIRSVADQTNLLALNAAIEAARAGEQGRGFAVVADEVRALAKRTQDSTIEIANVVDELNESSKNAFSAIAIGSKTATQAVADADEINSVLAQITQNMKELADLSLNVDQSARQQTSSLAHMTKSIQDVNAVSDDNAINSEQTAVAAEELSETTNGMLNNIKRYKVV